MDSNTLIVWYLIASTPNKSFRSFKDFVFSSASLFSLKSFKRNLCNSVGYTTALLIDSKYGYLVLSLYFLYVSCISFTKSMSFSILRSFKRASFPFNAFSPRIKLSFRLVINTNLSGKNSLYLIFSFITNEVFPSILLTLDSIVANLFLNSVSLLLIISNTLV